jgi:hypothetical protein
LEEKRNTKEYHDFLRVKKQIWKIEQKNEEIKDKTYLLQSELKKIETVEKKARKKAELLHIPYTETCHGRRRQEITDKLQTLKEVEIPLSLSVPYNKGMSDFDKISREISELEKELEFAKELAEKCAWKHAYEKYAKENKVKYDPSNEDDIFQKCNEHHQEELFDKGYDQEELFDKGDELPVGYIAS